MVIHLTLWFSLKSVMFSHVLTSDMISDHFSVVADLRIPANHSHTAPRTIMYRKLKAINIAAFKADIKNSELIRYPKTNATEMAQQYGCR